MEIRNNLLEKIILELLKDFSSDSTVTFLSRKLHVSRVGIWKAIKKLEAEELIKVEKIGDGKTSVYRLNLNWENVLTESALLFYLTKEASQHKRWLWDFKELKNHVDFSILFGSILHSPKEANDIDIINVISNKREFTKIDEIIKNKQITQLKKIHAINFTQKEFKTELMKSNKAFIDAIKKGVVLFGQEKFVKFMKELENGS